MRALGQPKDSLDRTATAPVRSNLERARVSQRVRGDTADTEVNRPGAALERARADRSRARVLFEACIPSRSALEAFEIEERVADAAHRAALTRASDRKVAQSEAAAGAARVALERTRIVAPFDGVVAARYARTGQAIAPTTSSVSVVDRADIHVRETFDEVDIGRIEPGRPVRLAGDLSAVRPGMPAGAENPTSSRDGALLVPTDAVLDAGDAAARRVRVAPAPHRPSSG